MSKAALALAVLLACARVASAQAQQAAPAAPTLAPDSTSAATALPSAPPTVAEQPGARAASRLQAGDVVRLAIWREKDLSGDFLVDEHGAAVLPKIGAVDVAGVDVEALKSTIVEAYAKYLRNPSISVTFLRRVTVLGAVMKPGVFTVDPTMTVADAVALAGGSSPDGRRDRVDVLRGGSRIAADLSQRTRIADSPIRSGDELYVPERTWISRNAALVVTIVSVGASLLIAFRP